jgi:hypothetical protein
MDWENYHSSLARALRNTDERLSIKEITKTIFESAAQNIKRTSQEIPKRKLKWMTPQINDKIRERRKTERKYKRTSSTDNLIISKD